MVCIALTALQLLFYTGTAASDDLNYLLVARDYQGGRPTGAAVQIYARIAAWVPLRICTWIVGPGVAALWPMPLIVAFASLGATWAFARRHLGAIRSWWAILALGLSPYFILYATIWQPDTLAGLCMMLALIVVAPALLDASCARPVVRALIGGFVIGLGYSAKETSLLAGVGLALFVLLFRVNAWWAWRRVSMVALGALAWLGIEALIGWAMTGDPVFHLHSIAEGQRGYGSPVREGMLKYFLIEYLRWLVNPAGPYGWWGPAYIAAGILALSKSPDIIRMLLCVLGVTFVFLTVGTVDLRSYFPIYHQPRYLLPLFPMGAVLIACAFDRMYRRGPAGRAAVAIATLALVINSVSFASQKAAKFHAADTYAAGRKLFDPVDHPWVQTGRLCASPQTCARLWPLAEGIGRRPIERITSPPTSPAEWLHRYRDAYVLVSKADRKPYSAALCVISPESRAALSAFPVVAHPAPATTRLREVGAWLGFCQPRLDRDAEITVHHITATNRRRP